MKNTDKIKIVLATVLAIWIPSAAQAQDPEQAPVVSDLQKQLEAMREQVNHLQNRINALESKKRAENTGLESAPATSRQVATIPQALPSSPTSSSVQISEVKSTGGPLSFHTHGTTLTLGGFLDAAWLYRTRNENADIANSYTLIPLNGSSNARLSELRGSIRNSELSLLFQGADIRGTKLTGYVETDFLGAAPPANYVESNSWTPRLRQLWIQFDKPSGWTITGGQMWSLLTTNRKGIATLTELRPIGEDGNYAVGFTWTRQLAFRLTRNFNHRLWAALAIESPETTYAAAFVPSNIMGLNSSPNTATGVNLLPFLSNYSNGNSTNLAPDLVAKAAYEPGWGHFEIKALGRFFRDRIASTATTAGHTNTTEGYGVGFGALMPFAAKKLDISLEGLLGQGIGRYGSSGLPDVTINPATGELRPLRQAWILAGLVYHASSHLNLYSYGGDEYTGRYAFVSPTGTAAGYGSPLANYSNCASEVGLNSCNGANRNIYEATVGYWYRLYRGEYGRIEFGNQIAYLHRDLWSGTGRTPQGGDLVAYSSFRFYLP